MDALRLILLLIGIVIILFIYLRGRKASGDRLEIFRRFDSGFLSSFKSTISPAQPLHPKRDHDVTLAEEDLQVIDGLVAERHETAHALDDIQITTEESVPVGGEPLVITLSIMPRQGKIDGPLLASALAIQGYRFGDMLAFHMYAKAEQTSGVPICSVVNVVEPGSFPDAELRDIEVPGLMIFMQLPGPIEPREAFDRMLESARQLARQLDADLCDDSRSVLTQQTVAHLKEKLEAYRFKQKMAQLKRRPK